MPAQLRAILATVHSVAERLSGIEIRMSVGMAVTALVLCGCMPATVPLAGTDPADPGAKVAGIGYRSTIAPYTSLRPTAPSSWREQNERVTPAPKSGQ
jgi:hypothetical protein